MTRVDDLSGRLVEVIAAHGRLTIAVSGGVDSMVLAYLAHRHARESTHVVHAVSPAVPAHATERVQRYARSHGWNLRLIDAEELADADYRRNPVDRCFYCKNNLYGHIRAIVAGPIASGTNVDDLSDFRPGLEAARAHGVVHPYVDAGLGKADIYALATALDLADLATLPAQPCLASRIETGIPVDAASLRFIEQAEEVLARQLPGDRAIRCRITAGGVYVESEAVLDAARRVDAEQALSALCAQTGRKFAGFRAYRRGAAFLHKSSS